MALFSGMGERDPQGPLEDKNNTKNGTKLVIYREKTIYIYAVEWTELT
jgi:hypothetical protein